MKVSVTFQSKSPWYILESEVDLTNNTVLSHPDYRLLRLAIEIGDLSQQMLRTIYRDGEVNEDLIADFDSLRELLLEAQED